MSNAGSEFRYAHRIQVRFRDCDPMGHVNNAVYFTYLEVTRFAYWRDVLGLDPANHQSFILARAECDFRGQPQPGDLLDVRMRVGTIGRSSYTFEYEIVNVTTGTVVATARTVQVAYDYQRRRSVPLAADVRRRLEQHEGRSFDVPAPASGAD